MPHRLFHPQGYGRDEQSVPNECLSEVREVFQYVQVSISCTFYRMFSLIGEMSLRHIPNGEPMATQDIV
jgi:hypothetical protein